MSGKLAQARDGARQIERLPASRGMPVPVTGARSRWPRRPRLRHGRTARGHACRRLSRLGQLVDAVAVSEPVLDQVAAHVAVCELLTYCGQRTDYELAHSR